MNDIPFVAYGNDELERKPHINEGDKIICPHCGKEHEVQAGTNAETGKKTDLLLFYHCGDNVFLAGVAGKNVMEDPK